MPQPPPTLWLFDLGNSSLKARVVDAGTAPETLRIDWGSSDLPRALAERLATWPAPSRVLVASVAAPARANVLRSVLARRTACDAEWLSTPHRAGGVTNAYKNPERLGIDRFAALIGAHAEAQTKTAIVIGCGTALTLDAVNPDGQQLDGLIAPSPHLMLRSLGFRDTQSNTSRRPEPATEDGMYPGRCDTDAYRGCLSAAAELTRSYILQRETASDRTVTFIHGGGALVLKAQLESDGLHMLLDNDLIWRGMEAMSAHPHWPDTLYVNPGVPPWRPG